MNEIVIDDKKYVSSKQAAELTGYAKDYVGQLCREGRVPARLIGRSWYVLASAIEDHKFGTEDVKKTSKSIPEPQNTTPVISQTWDQPLYKPETESYFPSINKLTQTKKTLSESNTTHDEEKSDLSSMQVMHEAWKDWFSGLKQPEATDLQEEANDQTAGREDSEELFIETAEVHVPIRSIEREERRAGSYEEQEASALVQGEAQKSTGNKKAVRRAKRPNRALQATFLSVALVSICIGVIGSGLLDKIISFNIYLSEIAGITTIIHSK